MRSLAKPDTGFSHPKIQNPESGIRDVPCDFGSKILDPESGKGGGALSLRDSSHFEGFLALDEPLLQSTVERGRFRILDLGFLIFA